MLSAEKKQKNSDELKPNWSKKPVYSTKFPSNHDWRCPLCKEKVIYVNESKNGRAEHFRHKEEPEHPSPSEGPIHLKAKKVILRRLISDNKIADFELEKILGEFDNGEYQIADIWIKTKQGEEVAVEIQISNQAKDDFEKRTNFYSQKDVATLWIIGNTNYLEHKVSSSAKTKETVSFKDSVKWIQKNYFGRCYVLNSSKLTVNPHRLTNLKVMRESNHPDYPTTEERLSSIAEFSTGKIDDYGIVILEDQEFKIARFYDKCWWN